VLATLAVVPMAASVATAASTAAPVTINISQVTQMVVDSAQSLIFFASGQAGPIVVTNLAGTPDTTVDLGSTSGDAVDGLAQSPDGSLLFATIPGDDEIAAIDTTDLSAPPTLYSTDVGTVTTSCPTSVVTETTDTVGTAGSVWFSYGCSTTGALGSINLATGTVTDYTTATNDVGPAQLTLSAAAPTTLVAVSSQSAPNTLDTWDISTGAPSPLHELSSTGVSLSSITIGAAGGSPVLYAAGVDTTPSGGNEVTELSLSSLTAIAHVSGLAAALAVDPVSGDLAIDDFSGSSTGSQLDVWEPGLSCLVRTSTIPISLVAAVGFSSDASTLYAVGLGSQPTFSVASNPTNAATRLTAHAGLRNAAGALTVSGAFSRNCDSTPGPVTLAVMRSNGVSNTSLASVTTAADGSYSLVDSPPTTHATATYTVTYAGAAGVSRSSRAVTADLAFPLTLTVIPVGPAVRGQGTVVRVFATSGPTPVTAHLPLTLSGSDGKGDGWDGGAKVNNGEADFDIDTPRDGHGKLSVEFDGDARYRSATGRGDLTIVAPQETAVATTKHGAAQIVEAGKVSSLHAKVIGVPSVIHVESTLLTVATFSNHHVYVRTQYTGWRRLETKGPHCISGPAVTIDVVSIAVACEGSNRRLSYAATPWDHELPTPTGSWHQLSKPVTSGPSIGMMDGVLTALATGRGGRVERWRQGKGWSTLPYIASAAPGLSVGGTTAAIVFTTPSHDLDYGFCAKDKCQRAVSVGHGFTGQPSTYNTGRCQVLWADKVGGGLQRGQICSSAGFNHVKYTTVLKSSVDGVSATYT
jgi:hypothetical protein